MKTQTIRTGTISKDEAQSLLRQMAETMDESHSLQQMISRLRRSYGKLA